MSERADDSPGIASLSARTSTSTEGGECIAEPGIPPLFLKARRYDAQARRWVPVRVAVVLPPTSLEDYDYQPENDREPRSHKDCPLSEEEYEKSHVEVMERDMTMWMYVQPLEEKRRRKTRVRGRRGVPSSSTTTQPPSRVGKGRNLTDNDGTSEEATSPVSATSPTCHASSPIASSPWSKLKVSLMVPRSASCPLSQDFRASLQLGLVDSQAMTYTSHGTPRVGSLVTTPQPHSVSHDQQPPLLSLGDSLQSSGYAFSFHRNPTASSSADNRNSGSDPKSQQSHLSVPQLQPCRNSSHSPFDNLPADARQQREGNATPPQQHRSTTASPPHSHRLLHALGEPHSRGLPAQRRDVVDSMAELYQIEVRSVTSASASSISAAERRMLLLADKATHKTSGGFTTANAASPSVSAGEQPAPEKHRLSYKKVKSHFLSWFSLRKDSKPAGAKNKKKSITAGESKDLARPARRRESVEQPRPASPEVTSPLFPHKAKVFFLLRFYTEADYLILLRWYVWMRHTRKQRSQSIVERSQRQGGRSYISYDPRDIAREEEIHAAFDDDDDEAGLIEVDEGTNVNPEPSASQGGGVSHFLGAASTPSQSRATPPPSGGLGGGGGVDRRWESYIRRERDPRNGVRFAHIPVFLWQSFLPLASDLWYHCERGFLSMEASHSGQDAEEGLSPFLAVRRADPLAESLDAVSVSTSSGQPLQQPHRQQPKVWDTVKLHVSSPLAPNAATTPSFPHFSKPRDPTPSLSQAPADASASFEAVQDYKRHPASASASQMAASPPPHHHQHHHQHQHPSQQRTDALRTILHAAGAEFKDCFMCLTESHLLFYNSFGELRAHWSLDHIDAVFYSCRHAARHGGRKSGKNGEGKHGGPSSNGADDGTASESGEDVDRSGVPPSYPFITFKIKAGKEELNEPPLLATFTLLPLYPHFTSDCLAQDDVPSPQIWHRGSSNVSFDTPAFAAREEHEGATKGRRKSSASGSDSAEDLDVYQARILAEWDRLIMRKTQFLQTLTELVPNTFSEPMSFGAYLRLVRQRAALPVHPTMGRLGTDTLDSKVPLVKIYEEDVTAELEHESSFVASNASFGAGSRENSSLLLVAAAEGPRPPARPPSSHVSHEHGLSLDVTERSPSPTKGYIRVPKNRVAASYSGREEHRRLQSVYAKSSSLSCRMAAASPAVSTADVVASDAAPGMEKVSDFDLAVRLASHPVPLVLEKEDLFLPPLRYYASNGFDSSVNDSGSPIRTAGMDKAGERQGRDALGKGNDKTSGQAVMETNHSMTGAGASGDVYLGDMESSPKQRPSAHRQTSSSVSVGSPYAAIRPKKHESRLQRAKRASK